MSTDFSRRDFLAATAAAAGASVILLGGPEVSGQTTPTTPGAGDMATGIVFDDAVSTGKRVSTSKGVENVLVSNGRAIVKTDASGRYRIPVRDGDVLFMIKPSGWMTAMTEENLPRFYYFHRPTGSPKWKDPNAPANLNPIYYFDGMKPTGALPESIDFPLRKHEEPAEFKVLVFGDTQVSHDRQLEWMSRDTIAELVNMQGIAFGISLGDLVNVGLCQLFPALNEMQAKTGFPWYVMPGNHDQNIMTPDDSLADEQFRTVYGPTTYAFEYGPVSFLMLENIDRRPPRGYNVDEEGGKLSSPQGDNYGCGMSEDQWAFVESYLKTVPMDRPLILSMHIPITGEGEDDKAFCNRLMRLISGREVTLSMSGHTHRQRHSYHGAESGFAGPGQHHHFNSICVRGDGYRGMFDELRIPTCQATDGTPNGYSVLTLNKDGYSIRYKPSRQPADYQMNVFVAAKMRARDVGKQNVLANVFASSERCKVRMRVNGGTWSAMALTPQQDPSMTWVLESQAKPESWLGSKYRLDAADLPLAYHIWQAPLVDGEGKLARGTHTLEVETTDQFGATHQGMTLFRVV